MKDNSELDNGFQPEISQEPLKEGSDEVLSQKRAEELQNLCKAGQIPEGFFFSEDDWLFHVDPGSESALPVKVCSRFEIVARTRDSNGNSHGRLLRFWDQDGIKHEWATPMKLFASDGKELRSELLDQGLRIGNGRRAASLLGQYIQESTPDETRRCVSRCGWHGEQFVLHGEVIGAPGSEQITYQSDALSPLRFSSSGALEGFYEITKLASGNDLAIFAISLAFAAPLIHLVGAESGGFNLVGPSSIGKTKLLRVAASVWGSQKNVQQWRATANGLEGLAQCFNDCLLCLDELGQIEPEELDAAYTC